MKSVLVDGAQAMLATLLCLFTIGFVVPSTGAVVVVPTLDLALTGITQTDLPDDGVSTSDLLEYRLTVTNRGEIELPAGAMALKMFVESAPSGATAEMEVVRFTAPQFSPLGTCGNGRTTELFCTNRTSIEPNETISLVLRHRHPEPVAGRLRLYAELSPHAEGYVEPAGGSRNNGFAGTVYAFADQVTTTTTTTTTTTMPTTSTTTDPGTSTTDLSTTSTSSATTSSTDPTTTTTDPSTSTSDSSSSTELTTSTTSATTSSVSSTSSSTSTSTTAAPTTTVVVTTADPSTTSSLASSTVTDTVSEDAIAGPQASVVANVDQVAGISTEDQLAEDAAALLDPTTDDDGGPPYLLIAGILALLALLGGLGLALYSRFDNDPPLVDLREWDRG